MIGFITFLVYVIAIFLIDNYVFFIGVLLVNMLIIISFRLNFRKVFNNFIGISFFSLFTFAVNLIVLTPFEAFIIAVKLLLVCNVTYIFSKIFTPFKMIEALEKLLYPVQAVGVQSRDIGILICIAISFIPIFKEEMIQVLYAMKAKSIRVGVKNFYLILSPMIGTSIKKTNDVELALKAKGYR